MRLNPWIFLSLLLLVPSAHAYQLAVYSVKGDLRDCAYVNQYIQALIELQAGKRDRASVESVRANAIEKNKIRLNNPAAEVIVTYSTPLRVAVRNVSLITESGAPVRNVLVTTDAPTAVMTKNELSIPAKGIGFLKLSFSLAGFCRHLGADADAGAASALAVDATLQEL